MPEPVFRGARRSGRLTGSGYSHHRALDRAGEHMVVQAYILIQTDVGKAAEVADAIADIKGVTMAEDVTGPYDVIVRAEARNVDELGKPSSPGADPRRHHPHPHLSGRPHLTKRRRCPGAPRTSELGAARAALCGAAAARRLGTPWEVDAPSPPRASGRACKELLDARPGRWPTRRSASVDDARSAAERPGATPRSCSVRGRRARGRSPGLGLPTVDGVDWYVPRKEFARPPVGRHDDHGGPRAPDPGAGAGATTGRRHVAGRPRGRP